jgi:hypothetical protein
MVSITTGIKAGFEQKYVLRLVTNAWYSFQLLQYGREIESTTFAKMKQTIKCNSTRLKDFVIHLALAPIRSADERMYYMDKVTTPAKVNGGIIANLPLLPFHSDESMLMDQLAMVKWPKRFKISHFNKNKHHIVLRLTHSTSTRHKVVQLVKNHGKNHCFFAMIVKPPMGVSLCKVLLCKKANVLCKTAKKGGIDTQSCYEVWHTVVDLMEERQKYRLCRHAKKQSPSATVELETSKIVEVETREKKKKKSRSGNITEDEEEHKYKSFNVEE